MSWSGARWPPAARRTWARRPAPRPPALADPNLMHTGFYDPELNVHLWHAAGDGRDNGTMWAYRYRRALGK